MTIKIFNDRIEFGTYTLREDSEGFTFDGQITANTIIDSFQGATYGHIAGGGTGGPFTSMTGITSKYRYQFASDNRDTDAFGDLSVARSSLAGQSSKTSGYHTGGTTTPNLLYNTIDKYPFSASSTATDVGDLTVARRDVSGQSSSTYGYTSGGADSYPFSTQSNVIDRFPFASDGNASDVGDLDQSKYGTAGHSSTTDGYASGGKTTARVNNISKFPFATNASATNIGSLTVARWGMAGQSSQNHGYASGGNNEPYSTPTATTIDKFPFATDANATDVGDLAAHRWGTAGFSSITNGYTIGGYSNGLTVAPFPVSGFPGTLDTFPFATDNNAVDVNPSDTSSPTNSKLFASANQV